MVDDEPLVGLLIQRALEDRHAIVTSESALEAWDLLAHGERFDLIVSDLHMPGKDGIWLHEQVERLDAGLARRMLFLTGGATTAEAQDFLKRPGVQALHKPFRSRELFGRVELLLSS